MGGRTAACPVDVSNHTPQVNRRDPLFDDLRGRDCYSSRNKLSNTKTNSFCPNNNNKLLEKSLDLIEERREKAMVQLAYYQHKLKQGYDAKVKPRPLVPGDLVLRKVMGTTKNLAWEKLGPNWVGPYRITSVAGIGAYFLEDLDEHIVPRPWNVNNLKMYYY